MSDINYKQLLNNIKVFVFDVDGVLTDGKLHISENGELLRQMNVKDGFAMKYALDQGYNICIISGGTNQAVKSRLNTLGIKNVYLGIHDKVKCLEQLIIKDNYSLDEICYMGDDIPDMYVMEKVGLACCPQNAVPEVKRVAHYISHRNGGDSCVRDIIEQVLKTQQKWLNPNS